MEIEIDIVSKFLRVLQEVELDSKIKLIDCPGIVFAQTRNSGKATTSNILKNAQRISDVKDPFKVAETILQRASKMYFCRLYDITEYDSAEEFFAKKAARMGKFRRGGVPDVEGAARSLLTDWNTGKIKYCTQPPEESSTLHISASIVSEGAREFDIENFDAMETDVLDKFDVKFDDIMDITSTGPVNMEELPERSKLSSSSAQIIEDGIVKDEDTTYECDNEPRRKRGRIDPQMLLEGMVCLNR